MTETKPSGRHPARLFSALVATWADADQPHPLERAALEWLEAQPPPTLQASHATPRSVITHFVPVNDARVVPKRSYDSRERKTAALMSQIREVRAAGAPDSVQKHLRSKLCNQRDVSGMVSSAGRTPIGKAVDIMPPGWLTIPGRVRTRQPRGFPSVTPTEARVTYLWDGDPPSELADAIDRLCSRPVRLGHSSSLVSARVTPHRPTPSHVPGDGAAVLRSVRSGQLAALEREFRKHGGIKPRSLPFTTTYRKPRPKTADCAVMRPDTAGEWLVFGFLPGSRMLPSTRTVQVATALRGAVFHHTADPIPEGVSGHRRDGRPSTQPHAGFLALPWVGRERSDGQLMGAAVNLPDGIDRDSRRALLRAVGRWEAERGPLTLTLGPRGVLRMERVVAPSPLITLRLRMWSGVSHRWVSATPLALPTHPGALRSGTGAARSKAWARAERAVIRSCRHVGLPEPADVRVALAPLISGAKPAAFPAFRQRGRANERIARRLVHTALSFDRPVAGPMLLGAGRYLGLGLMRPVIDVQTDVG